MTASTATVRGPRPLGAGYVEDLDQQTDEWVSIPVTAIRCPVCDSTARQCKRPSGWGAAEWHSARRLLAADMLDTELGVPA